MHVFQLFIDFQWHNQPFFALTDKVTVGFPSSAGVFIPVRNRDNTVQGFSKQYGLHHAVSDEVVMLDESNKPDAFEPGAGLSGSHDLALAGSAPGSPFIIDGGNYRHTGKHVQEFRISDYNMKKNGAVNFRVQYAHKRFGGNMSLSVFPSVGLGISEGSRADTKELYLEIDSKDLD